MLNLFFILLAVSIFYYFCRKNILWGIGLIIIFLPSYLWRFSIGSLPSTFLEMMLLILFFVWALRYRPYQKFFWQEIHIEKKWLLVSAVWLAASCVAWLVNPNFRSLGIWRAYFLEPVLFFLVLLHTIQKEHDYKLIIKSLTILIFWLSIFAIVQNFTAINLPAAYDYPNVKRLTSVFSYPNALSLLTAAFSGFLVAYYFFKQRQWEYLVIGVLGIFLSWWAVSQGALTGLLCALLLVALIKMYGRLQNKRQKKIFLGFFIALFLFLASTPMARGLYQEIFHPVFDLQASSLEIRSSQWQETWQMLKHDWFLGVGLNAYQAKLIPYHRVLWLEIFLYPHNIFLNFWVEMGLFGLSVFLLIMYFVFRELQRLFLHKNKLAWPLLVLWVVWFVHGLVDVPYFKNDLSLLFFIFLILTIKAKKIDDNLQSKQILV